VTPRLADGVARDPVDSFWTTERVDECVVAGAELHVDGAAVVIEDEALCGTVEVVQWHPRVDGAVWLDGEMCVGELGHECAVSAFGHGRCERCQCVTERLSICRIDGRRWHTEPFGWAVQRPHDAPVVS